MTEHKLRLTTGLILAAWVITHLVNHTFGWLSLDAMEAFRAVNTVIWRSIPGTVALYASLVVHFALALWSVYRRRSLRMPGWEWARLTLGILIPVLLIGHIVATRVVHELTGSDTSYQYVVYHLWANPWLRIKQPILLFVVWIHLAIGLHYWLRLKAWYPRAIPYLYPLAVLIPLLALMGYVRAGLESETLVDNPAAMAEISAVLESATGAQRQILQVLTTAGPMVIWALLLAVLAARLVRNKLAARFGSFRITHASGKTITSPVGRTVLEVLRAARVPHASVCGGRARCTTCRVRVGEGIETLPACAPLEAAALRRINAAANVRLACQLRPQTDLAITPLLPPSAGAGEVYRPGGVQGHERSVAALFVDLRGSTQLGEQRFPYDVVFILNRFFAEMTDAIDASNGHYAQFTGDGLMALYGLKTDNETGCRDALRGAIEMSHRIAALNRELKSELSQPLRIGIGIHSGEAIVGTMGPPASPILSAIGDNINIAARLEAQTKVYHCSLVVSAQTAEGAGIDLSAFRRFEASVRGRDESVAVYAIENPSDIAPLFHS